MVTVNPGMGNIFLHGRQGVDKSGKKFSRGEFRGVLKCGTKGGLVV
jgi:hypothetical protein